MGNNTLDYYNNNAATFSEGTQSVDFHETQERFLSHVKPAGRILDFGCGAGRDTKYFLEHGYGVDATDGSEELCKIAAEFTGIQVNHMYFQELDASAIYDGIWACASILHLEKAELPDVMRRMAAALTADGVIYTSFKYGDFEGYRGERFFTNFTEESFEEFMKDIPELAIEEYWITGDVRPGRGEEKWLNLILKKTTF